MKRDSSANDRLVAREASSFGVKVFLVSLAMLFIGAMVGYVVIRIANRGQQAPVELPLSLLLSTAIILASSATLVVAMRHLRAGRPATFRRAFLWTGGLAIAFLLVQAPSLASLLVENQKSFVGPGQGDDLITPEGTLAGALFFLIFLHGLHVLGGIIPLFAILRRTAREAPSPDHHPKIHAFALYWHFLDGVWITLYATLLIAP